MNFIWKTFFLLCAISYVMSKCTNNWDCSLNGDCFHGKCICDAAWTNENCSQLNLLPLPSSMADTPAYKHLTSTSWGGIPVRSSDGFYHLYVSEMDNNCTLSSWVPNSRVVHAVSPNALGPYYFYQVVFPTFHHNPTIKRAPDGTYVMYLIGKPMPSTPDCSSRESDLLAQSIVISYSQSPEGPWSEPFGPILSSGGDDAWDYVATNPGPVFLPNGTVYLFYRGTPKYSKSGQPMDLPERIGLAWAPSWKGPYQRISDQPILETQNEDPFVWRDDRGFHMITHGRDDWAYMNLAYSLDGLNWSPGNVITAGPNVTLTNGTVLHFGRRERPQIYFNETTGKPAVLFTGVTDSSYGYAYTISQPIAK